jgi:glycine/D-amino acid oxidase-like deaminating enzyme
MSGTMLIRPFWERPENLLPLPTPIHADERIDVAIVGGGIMGLSTALHAARRGLSVRLIEAAQIGSGASGLNGGQVIPGLKYDPEWLIKHFGLVKAEPLIAFAASTADLVFDLISRESLDVPHQRNGWIQAVHTQAALQAAQNRHRQWAARGADVTLLDAGEIAAMTGARGYIGGWLDRRAGVIDPLAYTLELARLANEAGVRITENDAATRLQKREGRWDIATRNGAVVNAASVVVATNAYSDALIPGLARTIVPLHSFQIATAPLPPELGAAILPHGQAVSDSRRILVYHRKSADGRLLLGGRGKLGIPKSPRDWAHLERAMLRLYPALEGIAIERRWFGRVAMTVDHLPHLHEPEKGLFTAAGCQGRGLGLMTALGPRIAEYIATGDHDALPLPITPIRPIPFHAFRQVGVAATIGWYRALDAFER